MASLTETRPAAGFILSEASGMRSRESATVADGETLAAGEVVMLSAGKLVAFDAATASEAVGVVIYEVDASDGDVADIAYIARDAEVNTNLLTYPSGQLVMTTADLLLKGIIVR